MATPESPPRRPTHPQADTGPSEPSPGQRFLLEGPTVSLPKGGGAIRGIGEKFSANPVTGTPTVSVPLPISPARGGFQPQLVLRYDSGSGNGPFGMGWSLSLPSLIRKTDKGLPRYEDRAESDVFVLAGAEDLVPSAKGATREVRLAGRQYQVRGYRPRVEGSFATIERWVTRDDPSDMFWRIIDRNNVTTWFGRTVASRVADAFDATRVFQWLPAWSHDDKGNAIAFEYVADDDEGIDRAAPWEAQRTALGRSAQRYLKRVRYGNRVPYLPALHPELDEEPLPDAWLFELVLDYGDHAGSSPGPAPDRPWRLRPDPFSSHRPGFELRTSRRCERALMFHYVPEDPDVGSNALVRSMVLRYAVPGGEAPSDGSYSTLTAVELWSHGRNAGGSSTRAMMPPVELDYSRATIDPEVRTLSSDDLIGLPVGVQGPGHYWVDLDGEGLSGVLAEAAGTWRYAANLGAGRFAPPREVARLPARRALSGGHQRLMDLDGNAAIDVVELDGPTPGFYERDPRAEWTEHVPFHSLPTIDWNDPNLRFVDLTGDGLADALITEDEVFTWYPSLGALGFASAEQARPPADDEGVRLLFADGTQTIFLADMCGDGLADLVRVRNGDVSYWPNLGYGRFGLRVRLGNAPRFDHDDQFDPRRLRLADIDGSGPTDILYLGRSGVSIYFNRAGNSLSAAQAIPFPFATMNLDAVQVADLFGHGTACLVWSSHLPADSESRVRFLDLMGATKPYLLTSIRNNLGGSTEIEYTPSTEFYLADKAAGTPWITRLPFPVHCVRRVTVRDAWRGTAFSSTYSYHHGYYDGVEREFRGFGRVEQVDVEDYGRFADANAGTPWVTGDQRLYQPPIKTITWYHTGLDEGRRRVLAHFEREYFPARYTLTGSFRERALPEPALDAGLDADEWREALRACKGMVLRQEVYELDVHALANAGEHHLVRLFSAATHDCHIQRLQARSANRHAVFLVTESEALSYHHELPLPAPGGVVDPDPRIAHTLTLRVDEYGQPLQTVSVGYPRVGRAAEFGVDEATLARIHATQAEAHLAYAEMRFTADASIRSAPDTDAALRHHRLRQPCDVRSFELAGIARADALYYRPEDFARLRLSDHYPPLNASAPAIELDELPYHRLPDGTRPQRRLVEHVRTIYFDDAADRAAPAGPLPFGQHGPRGLKYEDYKLALTGELLRAVFRAPTGLPEVPRDLLAWELHPGVTARDLLNDPARGGYLQGEALAARLSPEIDAGELAGQYWLRSGIAGFADDAAQHFFLPERYTDAFGATTRVEYDALDLYVRRVIDARENCTEVVRFDHRVLAPIEMVDVNGNHSEVCLDVLGRVVAVAVKGKPAHPGGWEGDDLEAFRTGEAPRDPAETDVEAFVTATALDVARARAWLARASSRFVYHLGETRAADGSVTAWAARPATACAIAREIHATAPGGDASPLQVSLACSDGGGNVLLSKQQAEPDREGGPLRWIVNGLTVLNNKGKPVKQYEPFFSDRFGSEVPRADGVTPLFFYDAAGRLMRTELPDGTFTRVELSPWHQRRFDASDTALESAWYARRTAGAVDAEDRRAARLSALHADTPTIAILDSLGREVIIVAHNRSPSDEESLRNTPLLDRPWLDQLIATHTRLDAEGKPLWIRDARGNLVMQYIAPAKANDAAGDELPAGAVPTYDIAGSLLYQHSMDAGDRWMLTDAAGQPFLAWDVNDRLDAAGQLHPEPRLAHTEYDALRRPLRSWLRPGPAPAVVVERFEYRDAADAGAGEARARNLLGEAVIHDDPSGRMELLRRSFTGQVQHEQRRLTRHTTARTIDWRGDEADRATHLEAETFTRRTDHDALGRMTRLLNWYRRTERVAVYRPRYNARGLLDSEELTIGAQLQGDGTTSGGRTVQAVHGIAYNAKGQRTRVRHGNGTETRYDYDERSFRLTQIRTTRPTTDLPFPGYHSNLRDNRVVQQLSYTYDAAGNITGILDEAWAPVFFRNQEVEPRNRYLYDALHRLIEATGRESASLSTAPGPAAVDVDVDSFPTDDTLRDYTQRYHYDVVGNFEKMRHAPAGGEGWTRHYRTAPDSNRLERTWTGREDENRDAVHYAYDTHGSMLNLANVTDAARIRWDWRDMIATFDLVGGGRGWYAYDAGKQRTRKRIERNGARVEERLYLGGAEVYRLWVGDRLAEEIETHHLVVDDQRVLMAEDVLRTENPRLEAGVTLFRYQYGNHLGSVGLELDGDAAVVSYEEYHPYGTTAYQANNRSVRATAKRYRYTGMERDEETGMSYHTARYYLPWLGRWASADSAGVIDGTNLYVYSRSTPLLYVDQKGRQAESEEEERSGVGLSEAEALEMTDVAIRRSVDEPDSDESNPHGESSEDEVTRRLAARLSLRDPSLVLRDPISAEQLAEAEAQLFSLAWFLDDEEIVPVSDLPSRTDYVFPLGFSTHLGGRDRITDVSGQLLPPAVSFVYSDDYGHQLFTFQARAIFGELPYGEISLSVGHEVTSQLNLSIEVASSGTIALSLNYGAGAAPSVMRMSPQELASQLSSIVNRLPPDGVIRILEEEGVEGLWARLQELGLPREISELFPDIGVAGQMITSEPGRGDVPRVQVGISVDTYDLTLDEGRWTILPDLSVSASLRLEFR